MSGGEEVVSLELTVTREKEVARLLKRLRPGWRRTDIILWQLDASSWTGYSVRKPEEKLHVQTFARPERAKELTSLHLLLSSQGLASPLEATFTNGLVCQHLPPVSSQHLLEELTSPSLPHSVGSLHRTLTSASKSLPRVNMFEQLAVWLQDGLGGESLEEEDGLPGLDQLAAELSHLEAELGQVGSVEVVVGHGDLSPASLLKAPSGQLVFTGLQHIGPAWQALELATLLISLRGLNKLEVLEAEEVLPPRSLLNRWLNQYLASYLDKPPHQVSLVHLHRLYRQVSLCALLHLLRETSWAMVTWYHGGAEAVKSYGKSRWSIYKRIKYNILDMKI